MTAGLNWLKGCCTPYSVMLSNENRDRERMRKFLASKLFSAWRLVVPLVVFLSSFLHQLNKFSHFCFSSSVPHAAVGARVSKQLCGSLAVGQDQSTTIVIILCSQINCLHI